VADVEIVDCDDLDLFVDDEHLVQILINFLSNAEKYGAPPITVRARRSERSVEVVVSDAGDGVPSDFRSRLFERFARASSGGGDKVGGTGLGLSLVAALAAINGGSAWYRSNEPKGSQFGVSLPVNDT
jgi:signal transduction histidine kinase